MKHRKEKVTVKKLCPECNSLNFNTINGNKVCAECGLVIETTLKYSGGVKFDAPGFKIIEVKHDTNEETRE